MSERSSFVTEYICCSQCFAEAKKVLLNKEKYLCSCTVPSWQHGVESLPIIAGKIGVLGLGNDYLLLMQILDELSPNLCHKMRLAFLSNSSEAAIITIKPGEETQIEHHFKGASLIRGRST